MDRRKFLSRIGLAGASAGALGVVAAPSSLRDIWGARQADPTTTVTRADMPAESVMWHGAVGDGVADDVAAFEQAELAVSWVVHPQRRAGGRVFAPFTFNGYRFSRPWKIHSSIVFDGASGSGWYSGTVLRPDAGVTAIVLDRNDSISDYKAGAWIVLREFGIVAAGKTTLAHGIDIKTPCDIEDVWVRGFKGDGIHVEAGIPATNANLCHFKRVLSEQNGGSGFFTKGNDANQCIFDHCDGSGNGRYGFEETSFLGNEYWGCHASSNTLGPYNIPDSAGVNGSLFVGCYSEGGQPPVHFGSGYAMVVGGIWADGFDATSRHCHIGAQNVNGIGLQVGPNIGLENRRGTKWLRQMWGVGDSSDSFLQFGTVDPATGIDEHYYRLTRHPTGWYYLDDGDRAIGFSDHTATRDPGSVLVGRGQTKFPNGFFLGEGWAARKHQTDWAPPTTGAYKAGDTVWNAAPAPGGKMGWVCVADGTPGTWKPFGAIDP